MKTIKVGLKNNPYNIYIGQGIFKKIPSYLERAGLGNLGIILTSPKIYSLYRKKLEKYFPRGRYEIITVADGENAKSEKWLFYVFNRIIKLDGLNKKPFILCLGGGTIGDLGGLAASLYKRGIPCVQIPTTLLAQIDASIGGKTAIDLKEAKNILGTFYQPKAVFIDPLFLNTLAAGELKEGIAEAVKYAIIEGGSFFSFLENNSRAIIALDHPLLAKLIYRCCRIKARIVADDEKEEKGLRTILNLGHTFAHALEASRKYKKISHGKAVSVGLVYAAELSRAMGKCDKKTADRIRKLLKTFGLPVKTTFSFPKLMRSFKHDKKFTSGKIRMVLIKNIGKLEVAGQIPLKTIEESLRSFRR